MLRLIVPMMWLELLGMLLLSGLCSAAFTASCGNHDNATAFLRPAQDGVGGRYEVVWCTDATPADTWAIELSVNPKNPTSCRSYGKRHSSMMVALDKKLPICPNNKVCLTYAPLDLIFSACYTIQNRFASPETHLLTTTQNISNEFTLQYFAKDNFTGYAENQGNYVFVTFFTRNTPIPYYTVHLTKKNVSSYEFPEWRKNVTDTCESSVYEIRCRVPVQDGSYEAQALIFAPWQEGFFHYRTAFHVTFEVSRPTGPLLDGSARAAPALWWACGALAGLCAVAALALLALRWRRAAAARKHVLREWLHRGETKVATEACPPPGPILLLYARECPAAEPVVHALRDLLGTVAPDQVYDIGSATTLALAAPSGSEWVRRMLARPDARVVLLQTPALQALHAPRLVSDAANVPRGAAPAIQSRRVPRARAGRLAVTTGATRAGRHGARAARRRAALPEVLPRHAGGPRDRGAAVRGPVPALRAARARAHAAARPGARRPGAGQPGAGRAGAGRAAPGRRAGARGRRLLGLRPREPGLPDGSTAVAVSARAKILIDYPSALLTWISPCDCWDFIVAASVSLKAKKLLDYPSAVLAWTDRCCCDFIVAASVSVKTEKLFNYASAVLAWTNRCCCDFIFAASVSVKAEKILDYASAVLSWISRFGCWDFIVSYSIR